MRSSAFLADEASVAVKVVAVGEVGGCMWSWLASTSNFGTIWCSQTHSFLGGTAVHRRRTAHRTYICRTIRKRGSPNTSPRRGQDKARMHKRALARTCTALLA